MQTATDYFHQLNQDYLAVHRQKEDLFWTTRMATSDEHDASALAENQWNAFISNPTRITEIKNILKDLPVTEDNNETIHGLSGWLALFEANAVESAQAQAQKSELIALEAALFKAKQAYKLSYIDDNGATIEAGLPTIGAALMTNTSEASRKSAHETFLALEQWVLSNGFIELVKARNAFARNQGFANYFDYSVQKTEHMSADALFRILDDFEQRTRDAHQRSLATLLANKGETALKAHNFRFFVSGDAMRDLDPYMPFSQSLRRWQESFGRLNINYSGADLTLDLLDRDGKYQNGFCHGPIPSYFDNGTWIPAKVNFTSNAKPDQVGAGAIGLATLFHEGGHAAHFANMKQNAPCFSQEFAPTSMAYAETQSMFLDSLIDDADWLTLYAKNEKGESVPDSVIQNLIESTQPFRAYQERSIAVVPYFERALYAMADADLTAANITQLARETEQKIIGLACSPRPLLAIPHLLSDESACSYQGYLLANMAVYQTRAFFINKYGYLCDNPAIGPALAEHYWKPGNSVTHNDTILALTGEGFNAKYLADECNASVEQAWQNAAQKIKLAQQRPQNDIADLNANIKVVDGLEVLASNEESMAEMNKMFEDKIRQRYGD